MQDYLRAVRFEHPDHIPVGFYTNPAIWHHYPKDAVIELFETHPLLFPDYKRPADGWQPFIPEDCRKDAPLKDPMGCVWTTADDGIRGVTTVHPIKDIATYKDGWKIADPETSDGLFPVDWKAEEARWKARKAAGNDLHLSLRHGHTFLQLCDLCGYEELLYAMSDEEPALDALIDELTEFNLSLVRRFVRAGADMICYPEDLGLQVGPMLSPALFRRYVKPAYERLMKPAQDAGIAIQMHSDGDIRELCDDLIASGVECINLQDLVNGVDWIAARFRGKICVDLDIDRQKITRFGTPAEVDALIKEEIAKLATPDGGLALTYGWYPGIPLCNVKALMDALENYAF